LGISGRVQVLDYGKVYQYQVSGLNNLAVVLNHFNKYPLQTTKFVNFILLSMAVDFYNSHKPLSFESLSYIIIIKATFPKGFYSAPL